MEKNDDIREESDSVIRSLYMELRRLKNSKHDIQKIEQSLSLNIYRSEEFIQSLKIENNVENLIKEYYRRRSVLKRLADGLVWTIMDCPENYVNALSIGNSPGFMAGKKGYKYERMIIDAVYAVDELRWAIQCDITNILRVGDVLVQKNDGQLIPIEVKGTASGRSLRQKKRVNEVLDFIRTGIYKNVSVYGASAPLVAYKTGHIFDHYWNELEELSLVALDKGAASMEIDECYFLLVFKVGSLSQTDVFKIISDMKWKKGFRIIGSFSKQISSDKTKLPRARLPITIFPVFPEVGVEYLLGNLDAIIIVNRSKINERLEKRGIHFRLHDNGKVVYITKNGFEFEIIDAWDKLLVELVTATNFVDYIVASSERIDKEYENITPNL